MPVYSYTVVPTIPAEPTQPAQLAPELCDAVDLLASGYYLVARPAAKTVSNGVVDSPPATYFWSKGSMQPVPGRDVQKLPEGIREKELKAFFTCDELKTKATALTGEPDRVTVDGELFEVAHLDDWMQLGAYHRVVLAKVNV